MGNKDKNAAKAARWKYEMAAIDARVKNKSKSEEAAWKVYQGEMKRAGAGKITTHLRRVF